MAAKVAVPTAAPTWVADPARPEVGPKCVSGNTEAMTMVVRVTYEGTNQSLRVVMARRLLR